MKNELRRDYLVDRWVIFAPGRAKRPSDYAIKRSKAQPKVCVFCKGHEDLTPPAKLLYVRQGNRILKLRDRGRKRRSDWIVRCVSNLYPAVSRAKQPSTRRGGSLYTMQPAAGSHEVIIESPGHEDHPHRASQGQVEYWLRTAIDRLEELGRSRSVASVNLFRNHGREAGASIAHAHSQIITTPIVPARLREEYHAMKKIQRETGRCVLCQISRAEAGSSREILSTPNYTVLAPWASVFPFEFWIVPKRHSVTIVGLPVSEIEDLARVIRRSYGALAKSLYDPPYNAVFHLGPSRLRDRVFHWHIEVYPKLAIHAGLELGYGIYINTMRPELAAKTLRAVL